MRERKVIGLGICLALVALALFWHGLPPLAQRPQFLERSVSTPAAPEILDSASAVINTVCVGECVVGGAPSWVTSDALVNWTHSDPINVDYYELWRSRGVPYFEPATCTACSLVAETTGLSVIVSDSPPGFNPVCGSTGAELLSGFDFYRVRAVNSDGASAPSNELGVVTYSLLQGIAAPR